VNAVPQFDPSTRLNRYLAAVAKRDATRVAECFAPGAVLDLPTVKPNRFVGLEEIKTAHLWSFENLEEARVETDEILSAEHCALAAGRLTVVCRGRQEIHAFGIAVESSGSGLSRVSWYFDSRGHRPWSDRTVL
jgi:SnoaL-like domain